MIDPKTMTELTFAGHLHILTNLCLTFFFLKIYLLDTDSEREREREKERESTQAGARGRERGRSRIPAEQRAGAQSQDPEIVT